MRNGLKGRLNLLSFYQTPGHLCGCITRKKEICLLSYILLNFLRVEPALQLVRLDSILCIVYYCLWGRLKLRAQDPCSDPRWGLGEPSAGGRMTRGLSPDQHP